mgnify:CR=1 FL=1
MARGNWNKHHASDICDAVPDATREGLIARCHHLYSIIQVLQEGDIQEALNAADVMDRPENLQRWIEKTSGVTHDKPCS